MACQRTWASSPDADSLYIPELWARLSAGGELGTWLLTPNPSLWPDLVLWHATQWFQAGLLERLQLYGLAVGWALVWYTARCLRALGVQGFWQSLSLAGTGLILGLMLAPVGPVMIWLAPAHQGTVLVAALWLWCVVLESDAKPRGGFAVLGLSLWLGLLLSSHKLLLPVALLPAVWLSLRAHRRGRLWVAFALSLGVAWGLRAYLSSTGAKVPVYQWAYLLSHFTQQWGGFWGSFSATIRGLGIFGIGVGLGAFLWAAMAVKERGLWTWALVAWALCLLGALSVGMLMGTLTLRYLLLPLWLPVLLLPAFFVRLWPQSASSWLLGSVLALLLWRSYLLPQPRTPLAMEQAQWLQAQAKERRWQSGWADYWMARPLRMLTQPSVPVLPVVSLRAGELEPHLFVVDRALFPAGDPLTRPDFVVSNGMDAAALLKRLGPLDEHLQGPGMDIWVYRPQQNEQGARP